jgi:hypothetical protein
MIREMNVAGGVFGYGGAGGDIGTFGGAVGNTDFYAPGDTRIPKILGAAKKSRKCKKKSQKIPMYRRAFIESITEEADNTDYTLNCLIYSENVQYQQIIKDMLNTFEMPFISDAGCVIIESNDTGIQGILEKIRSLVTDVPFETGEIVALVGEMDVSFKEPEKDTSEYDRDQLERGTQVELEHMDVEKQGLEKSRHIASMIAMNHLDEDPKYYVKLAKMEGAK